MNNHEYQYPVFVVTSGVAKSGFAADLAPGQIGLFSRYNNSVVGNPQSREEVFLAIGSVAKFDKLGDLAGFQSYETHMSSFFKTKDVERIEVSFPVKESKSNRVTVGFSGGSCSTGISYECDTTYEINFILTGSPILRHFGKPLAKTITYYTGCCPNTNCESCPDSNVDCEYHTKKILEAVNAEVELSQVNLKGSFISSTYAATAPNKVKYCLEVCDDGDFQALASIQATVDPLGEVVRKSRKDCKSEYTYCGDVKAPDFVPTNSVKLAVCGTCEAGFTLVVETVSVTVVRPIAGTDDTSTDAAKLVFATAVAGAYSGTNPVFGGQNGATATVTFEVPSASATTLVALLSDVLVKGVTNEAKCTPTAAVVPVAWVACGTAYKVKRKLKITLKRKECGDADRLAELTTLYANDPRVVTGSLVKLPGSLGCEDCYEIEQWSKGCMEDACLTSDAAEYDTFGSFDGRIWETVEAVAAVFDPLKKCGMSFEANPDEAFFGNCSFDPMEFYEDEPVHIEIGWRKVSESDACEKENFPLIKNFDDSKYRRQSGEWVIRKLIEYRKAYSPFDEFTTNPRIREAMGQEVLSQVDRKAFYKVYYVKFLESRAGVNTFSESPHWFETIIAFKESDPTASEFEKSVMSKLGAHNGLVLNNRTDLNW